VDSHRRVAQILKDYTPTKKKSGWRADARWSSDRGRPPKWIGTFQQTGL